MDQASDAARRRLILRQFEPGVDTATAHELYHDDAVLEFPQSGERFEGVENFREWRGRYPSDVRFEVDELRGSGELWVLELRASYDGGPWQHGVSVHEFRGDRVARETIYVTEPWDAPEWRARWRAAP